MRPTVVPPVRASEAGAAVAIAADKRHRESGGE